VTELEKIKYAKTFIDKLADGINPIDGKPVRDDDIINNVRICRCLSYVSDILEQVIENGGTKRIKNSEKRAYTISPDKLGGYAYSVSPVPLSEITGNLNALSSDPYMKKLNYSDISSWLLSIGALYESTDGEGKKKKLPTESGRKLGITNEYRVGQYGEYMVVVYDRQAQQFIVDNIYTILEYKSMPKR